MRSRSASLYPGWQTQFKGSGWGSRAGEDFGESSVREVKLPVAETPMVPSVVMILAARSFGLSLNERWDGRRLRRRESESGGIPLARATDKRGSKGLRTRGCRALENGSKGRETAGKMWVCLWVPIWVS